MSHPSLTVLPTIKWLFGSALTRASVVALTLWTASCGRHPDASGVTYQHDKASMVTWFMHVAKIDRARADLSFAQPRRVEQWRV